MLSHQDLIDELDYSPVTGLFRRKRSSGGVRAGSIAGAQDGMGYLRIRVLGRKYKAHRLAWLYVNGEWPRQCIDHIDGDGTNNAIGNLRDVSNQQNCKNQKSRPSKSWLLGVRRLHSGNYAARIQFDGKEVPLGTYPNLFDAISARKSAENKYGFHPNHGRLAA